MIKVDNQNILVMPEAVDRSKFFIPKGFELIELYAKIKRYIMSTYRKLKKSENGFTIGDIMLIPKWPRIFYYANAKPDPGAHGFDPALVRDMYTIFYARGSDFKAICRYLLSKM